MVHEVIVKISHPFQQLTALFTIDCPNNAVIPKHKICLFLEMTYLFTPKGCAITAIVDANESLTQLKTLSNLSCPNFN